MSIKMGKNINLAAIFFSFLTVVLHLAGTFGMTGFLGTSVLNVLWGSLIVAIVLTIWGLDKEKSKAALTSLGISVGALALLYVVIFVAFFFNPGP